MKLRIDDITIRPIGGPIHTIGNRLHTWQERRGVALVLESGSTCGVGEASPLPGYSRDSVDDVAAQLASLRAHLPFELDAARPISAPRAVAEALHAPAARFAFDTATIDLVGKATHKTAAEIIRGAPVEQTHVATTWLVDSESLEQAIQIAARARDLGVLAIKLKIGRDLDRELAIAQAIRRECPALEIRVDANQGIPARELETRLGELAAAGVDLVEEPSTADAMRASDLPIAIAIDESLRLEGALELVTHIAARRALGAIVLKPAELGWLDATLRWATVAHRLGARVVVSHLFDGPIAMSLYGELARALGCQAPQGLCRHSALAAFAGATLPQVRDARIDAIVSPGLGLQGEPW